MRTRALAGWLALLAVTVLTGAGCHPGEINEVSELDIVVTFYDEGVDYGAFSTYAMEDTIYNLAVLQDPTAPDNLERRFDAEIIQQIKDEMEARGYVLVDTTAMHDLRVGLGAFDVEGTALYLNFPWWGYGPGAWYPSWNSMDFTKGSLLVFMADWAGRDDQAQEVDPIWTAALDGVLEANASNVRTRLQNGISQMFIQSPYLKPSVTKVASGEVR